MTINSWLHDAAETIAEADIPSARLDAEIILAHTLRKSRTYLHAHGKEQISERVREIADARLRVRCDRVPIAYIIGHKEFYGRLFTVTPSVLIPRPESEAIITALNKHLPNNARQLVDIGTGSGCLGITAKLEHPNLDVTLSDTSRHALNVAEKNTQNLAADAYIVQSDLFSNLPLRYDVVLANLPYVDVEWERSPETDAEPAEALFAQNGGLAIIAAFINQLPDHTRPGSIVCIEADPMQHEAIIKQADNQGFSHLETNDYCVVIEKS